MAGFSFGGVVDGPVGQLAVRSARYRGVGRVIGVDMVKDRLDLARTAGAETVDLSSVDDVGVALKALTEGRGPDAVIDAVGMEAHGNTLSEKAIQATSRLPKPLARTAIEHVGIDRLAALHGAIAAVRRGGTLSISGVYGGAVDPMPMMDIFDKGITVRTGQCHVRRWSDELLGIVEGEDDVFGLENFATHHGALDDAPDLYRIFQEKADGCLKVVLRP